jgi:hypothetical protein
MLTSGRALSAASSRARNASANAPPDDSPCLALVESDGPTWVSLVPRLTISDHVSEKTWPATSAASCAVLLQAVTNPSNEGMIRMNAVPAS